MRMRIKHLLKTTALTALLLIGAKVGWGQAILTETFPYATPAYIGGNGNAGSSSNGWTTHSVTSGQTTTIDINDGSLSYPGLFTSSGNKVYLFGNNNLTSRDVNAAFTTTATTLYFSALVNIIDNSQINTTGDYFMSFCQTSGSSSGSLGGRLGAKSVNSGANFRFVVQNQSTGTLTWTDNGADLTFGTTYLVVIKYDRNASPTVATMWVNPSTLGGAEPSGSVSNSSGTGAMTAFGAIGLRNNATTPKAYIDEIRVGTTFADVTPLETTPPVTSFNPANAATGVEISSNIVISFDEAVRNLDGSAIADPTTLITFKETDAAGADVPFTATINAGKTQITIDPTSNLAFNKVYYVSVAQVEDGVGNEQVAASSASFTSRAAYTDATVTSGTYTVTGDPTWTISNIPANVPVATFESNLTAATGATFNTYLNDGLTEETGSVVNGDKVIVTAEDGSTNTYTLVVTPVLNADVTDNNVDNNIDIAFTYEPNWYAAILKVYVNDVELVQGTDYGFASTTKVPTVNALRLIPSATSNAVLRTSGTWNVKITATGYADATVSQTVDVGAISASVSTVTVSPALALNTTSTVTATAKDQYGNAISLYLFKFDLTVKNDGATGESYSVDGTDYTTTVSDAPLKSVTNVSGVVTFDIVVPATVDEGDGLSVQVQLNDGSTNVGSALEYYTPVGPSVSIAGTLNERTLNSSTIALTLHGTGNEFADATLDKANFTLNEVPAGVTIGDITYNSTTTATITLAFDGTDFDVDSTNVSVTVAGAELILGNPLISNKLTITAVVETAPIVTTNATITTNGLTTATWGGEVTGDGGMDVTQKGICWSTEANPTIDDANDFWTNEGAGIGTITGNMASLTPNTLYYVRAYAVNGFNVAYGTEYSFTTETPTLTIGVLSAATYYAGDNVGLTWTSNGVDNVKIELYNGTSYSTLVETTASDGSETITIPSATAYGVAYKIKISDASNASLSSESTVFTVKAVTSNLIDLQSMAISDIVKYVGKATVTYFRTPRNQKYIQDATGAILIDDNTTAPGFITGTYAIGDGITNVEGKIAYYNGIIELVPLATTGETCTGNPVITPEVKTMANLTMADQSKLIQVNSVTFTYPATEGDATGNFSSGKNYTISDGTSRDTVCQFRAGFAEADYIGTAIPTVGKNIVALVTMYKKSVYKKTIYQIMARSLSDFLSTGIEDNTNTNLTVYPNPFSNEIKLDATQNVKRIVISSITGQVVKNETIVGTSVNTESLPKGMYLVTLFNDKGEKATLKMIKQ